VRNEELDGLDMATLAGLVQRRQLLFGLQSRNFSIQNKKNAFLEFRQKKNERLRIT
jgi:hypothetical protein